MNITRVKRRLIYLIPIIFITVLILFLGLKIWIHMGFNQQGNLLLCNFYNETIYEITREGLIVWSFVLPRKFAEERDAPPYVQRLSNGNTLITDHDAGMVYEVNRMRKIVWKCDSLYKDDRFAYRLEFPTMALRLRNENTLIGDYELSKAVEVDKSCNIRWEWNYLHEDPRFFESLLSVYRFDNGNTAFGILKTEKNAQQMFFEYFEVEESERIVKRIKFDKIAFHPTGFEVLPDRHVLISFLSYGVAEVDTLKKIIWSFQLPDSVTRLYEVLGERTEPADADYAFRFSNGNTAIYCRHLAVYVVAPDGEVLWRTKHPTVKFIIGIKYLKDDKEVKGDLIGHLVGIVDK